MAASADYTDQYRGLIFDCDGTLTDSMPLHFDAWQRTLCNYGIEFSEAEFFAKAGMPSDRIIQELCDRLGVRIDVQAAAQQKEAAFEAMIDRLRPRPSVCQVAKDHYGKLPMAVASGGTRPVVQRQLRHIGVIQWFDAVVTAEDTRRHKPDPDVFLKAAELIGVDPGDCLVFEDSELGFTAARRAGMDWKDVR